MKYLITGGSGFLGRHICEYLKKSHTSYKTTVRTAQTSDQISTGDLTQFSDWDRLFSGVDVVVHCAAKAHDMSQSPDLPFIYDEVNHKLTLRMADAAKKSGVKRFIFISTVKVNGEFTDKIPFTSEDTPKPQDDYARSKLLAEHGLLKLHSPGAFEVVILRPCLIYGFGVKANFNSLIRLIKLQVPLPFAGIQNRRSYVSVDNLVDLIIKLSSHPNASGQIFMASDDQDLSLPELIRTIARANKVKTFLFPVPQVLLRLFLGCIGKSAIAARLFNNLQVDITKTKALLNWAPKFTMLQSLEKNNNNPQRII